MRTAEDDDDHDDSGPAPINLREMELHHCGPGRAGNPKTGEPIAILRFLWNRKLEEPIMLNLDEARGLLAKLVAVLDHHGDTLAKRLGASFFPDGEWPADASDVVVNRRAIPKFLARPSVNPNTPRKPLNDTDVWNLVRMLKNVRDHQTFMRFIGVPEQDIATKRRPPKAPHAKPTRSGSKSNRQIKKLPPQPKRRR
jgi:hypothetical protein